MTASEAGPLSSIAVPRTAGIVQAFGRRPGASDDSIASMVKVATESAGAGFFHNRSSLRLLAPILFLDRKDQVGRYITG